MMKWHKAKDELPPYDVPVLMVGKIEGRYISEAVMSTRLIAAYGDNVWWRGCDWRYVEDDDRWAYIELPEE